MRKLTITMMSLAVGLALVLSFLAGRLSVPVAMNDVIGIEEIIPGTEQKAVVTNEVIDRTWYWKAIDFLSKPGKTVTSQEETVVKGTDVTFGGFKTIKDAVGGPLVILTVGVILAVAGVACFIWLDRTKGLVVMAGGGVLILAGIMFESYPWLALVLPLLGIGFGVWWLLATKKGQAVLEDLGLKDKALVQVVAGVQSVKDTTAKTDGERAAINTMLKAEQDSDVQELVKEIKNGG